MINSLRVDVRPDWATITGKYTIMGGVGVREPEYSGDLMDIGATLLNGVMALGWWDYGVWKEVKAPPHYRYAIQSKEGGILIAFGGSKQGWMVQLQGVWWARRERWTHLQNAVAAYKLHVSRFDFSLTVQPLAAAESWAVYSGAWARMQKDKLYTKYPAYAEPYAPSDLKTITMGSRKSPVFIRCYDKRYWIDEEHPAVRLEAEYKKDAALLAFNAWVEGGGRSTRDVLRRFFGDSLTYPEPWDVFYDGEEHENIPSTIPPPPSDRAKWFDNIVKKAFLKWLDDDAKTAENWAESAANHCYGERKEDWLTDIVPD